MGEGHGDPRLQNCCYAALHSCDDHQKQLRALCRCPILLLELSGPNLSLSGFAYGQHPCCDQLSHTVFLLWQPKSELMSGAPRLVHAIRRAWPALQVQFQTTAARSSKPCKQSASGSPHFSSLSHWLLLTFCSTLSQAFYQEQGTKPSPAEPNPQLEFPYPCTWTSLHRPQCFSFSYARRLTDFTFLAIADGPAAGSAAEPRSGDRLLVKFCKK